MFKVTGVINGITESIVYSWNDGVGSISGDPMVMFLMRNSMERETPIGPVGQYLDRNIDEPLAALFMIMECFEQIIKCEGDIPKADPVPEGTLG